ncbi:MAG TPA: DUF899 family protein [Steroidobacteraceae bacterium]|nr:DUF899 family protein [Steroidobacteraceae bacterium]
MSSKSTLVPATELAQRSLTRFPGESEEYRSARTALLAEEIELRRHLERVAEMRRALPLGREVTKEYRFQSESGPVRFEDLFLGHQTLVTYSYMFGPQRERPCPMCTSFLSAINGEALDIEQRIGFATIARSPLEKLAGFKKERGWSHLRLYSDESGEFSRDYYAVSDKGEDIPAYNVFTRRNGKIYHFYAGEMGFETADPGQDPRGAPDLMPIWNILDTTPEGRGTDWYPSLEYKQV